MTHLRNKVSESLLRILITMTKMIRLIHEFE